VCVCVCVCVCVRVCVCVSFSVSYLLPFHLVNEWLDSPGSHQTLHLLSHFQFLRRSHLPGMSLYVESMSGVSLVFNATQRIAMSADPFSRVECLLWSTLVCAYVLVVIACSTWAAYVFLGMDIAC